MRNRHPLKARLWTVTVLVSALWLGSCQRPAERQAEAPPEQTAPQTTALAPSEPQAPAQAAPPATAQPGSAPRRAAGEAPAGAPAAETPRAAIPKPAPPPPKQARFEAGTTIAVRTTNTLSTKLVKTGERFLATLEEPLVSGDWVVAPKGATVEGRVVESDPGGRVKGLATLVVALESLTTADGRRVAIETSRVTVEAKSSVKKDAVKTGIASGIGAAIGGIAGGGKGAAIGAGVGAGAGVAGTLATRGDPAEIPAESVLRFQLSAPVTVTEQR
jgi:hypothetical protein